MSSISDTRKEVDRYLSYGFVLIPLVPGTSTQPAVLWKKEPRTHITATNNAVEKWYNTKIKKRYNVAVVCEPSNIIVLDIDTKSAVYGQRGGLLDTTAADLVARLRKECRPTEQTTKSNGTHMIFTFDYATYGAVSIGANVLCPGVEVKASGNMLPLAPTELWEVDPENLDAEKRPRPIPPGVAGHGITGKYTTEVRDRPEPMPVWLIEAVLLASKAKTASTTPREYTPTAYDPNKYDNDPAYWLHKAFDKARAGNGRNNTGFWLAQQLHDNEYSYDQALYVMADYQRTVEDWARPMYAWSEARESLDSAWSMTKRARATDQTRPINTPRATTVHTTHQDTPKTPTPTNDTTAANSDTTTRQDTPKTPTRTNGMPTLPQSAYIAPDVGNGACPWLDEYIAYSQRWSTRGYETFHLATGLWVLSTVAARRVATHDPELSYTQLYLLMAAPSSLYAKSTTAKIGIDVLKKSYLGHLLLPDSMTPAAFIANMSRLSDTAHANARDLIKNDVMLSLQFAGQRGWYFDEFGGKLQSIMSEQSIHHEYKQIMLKLDAPDDKYENSTIARGREVIYNPYLSLLAVMTPADMTRYAGKGHAHWSDGFWARFLFASPPPDSVPTFDIDRPDGARVVPSTLTTPLTQWHKRLGMPEVKTEIQTVELAKKAKTKATTKDYATQSVREVEQYSIDPTDHPRIVIVLSDEASAARKRYSKALDVIGMPYEDLRANYLRLADVGTRIAALFASMAGSPTITLAHWALAQQCCETFRDGLHNTHQTTTGASVETTARVIEDKITSTIRKFADGITRRELMRNTRIDGEKIDKVLTRLLMHGDVILSPRGNTHVYMMSETID
jgi:hypothetical protein